MGCARGVVARPTVVYVVSLPVSFGFNRLRRLQRLSTGLFNSCGVYQGRTTVGVRHGRLASRDKRNLQVSGKFDHGLTTTPLRPVLTRLRLASPGGGDFS